MESGGGRLCWVVNFVSSFFFSGLGEGFKVVWLFLLMRLFLCFGVGEGRLFCSGAYGIGISARHDTIPVVFITVVVIINGRNVLVVT